MIRNLQVIPSATSAGVPGIWLDVVMFAGWDWVIQQFGSQDIIGP